ncbi:hypothetical protein Tco_1042140 [Tanacetum coccineum]|uniref:Uncharacterized protein n=1 Tax=Tanacetum coccineum TaxID=301880 RepID=A0ABQ5GIU9_9ASTR
MNRLLSLFKTKPTRFKRYKSFFYELQGHYGYLFAHLRADVYGQESHSIHLLLIFHDAQSQTSSIPEQQYQLYLAMKADPQLQQQDIAIWSALQIKCERITVLQNACRTPAVRPRDQDDPHDDAHPEGENSLQSAGDRSHRTDSYASDDDEIPTKQVSQDIMEEVSMTIDEAKMRKMADEMLRQRCTSGDEHQYLNDQIEEFLKSDIVWRVEKKFFVYSIHEDHTLVHSFFIRSSVIWERVHDFQLGIESYQQKVNLTAPTITFPGIEEHDMFSIIYELVHGIIYKNSMKEKRVMRHIKIHKFCNATLNRVLEGLKSYNNDVKYGYVQKDLTKDETEYLKLFEWKTTWIKKITP